MYWRDDIEPYPKDKTIEQVRADYNACKPVPSEEVERVFRFDLQQLRKRYETECAKVNRARRLGIRVKDRRAQILGEIEDLEIKLDSTKQKILYYTGRRQ